MIGSGSPLLQRLKYSHITGYVQGAVNPLGLPETVPVIFDHSLAYFTNVNISTGDPMAGLELKATDLLQLAKAQLAEIVQKDV